MLATLSRILLLSLILCSVLSAQAPTKAKWQPAPLSELKNALAQNSADAEKVAYRALGKQSLMQGKAVCRTTGALSVWAVIHPQPAQLLATDGTVVGALQPVGKQGLQVLLKELPNFSRLSYKLVAGEKIIMAGDLQVEDYAVPKEALPQPGIPAGSLRSFQWTESKIFPNTERTVTVYTPAQYDAAKPPALMVWQDGTRHADPNAGMKVPVVLDHLISEKSIPVTIGIFIDPGRKKGQKPDGKAANRGFEYDSLGPAYSRLVLEEILPAVKQHYGLQWSAAPEDHAIAGGSSGGICAFTVAWERPDEFRKVLSWVGSFVDLRGGHVYPALIRTTERKPLRIYLLDGDNDLDNSFGNWPLANQQMAAALRYLGYDYRFDYGHCFHGSKGMAASLPEALRWLWRKE